MARRKKTYKNNLKPDPMFGNVMVTKLINRSMKDGKKSVAQKQIYSALESIRKQLDTDPVEIFEKALFNIRPEMEVRPKRVGGAAYQVPMSVRGLRRDSLAIRWLITASRAKSNSEFHTFSEKLAKEIIDASNNEGGAVKKRQEVEKIAEANKAFSHFNW